MLYTNYVPRGTTVNAAFILESVPAEIPEDFQSKTTRNRDREMVLAQLQCHDSRRQRVHNFLAKNNIQLLDHPPNVLN